MKLFFGKLKLNLKFADGNWFYAEKPAFR